MDAHALGSAVCIGLVVGGILYCWSELLQLRRLMRQQEQALDALEKAIVVGLVVGLTQTLESQESLARSAIVWRNREGEGEAEGEHHGGM